MEIDSIGSEIVTNVISNLDADIFLFSTEINFSNADKLIFMIYALRDLTIISLPIIA